MAINSPHPAGSLAGVGIALFGLATAGVGAAIVNRDTEINNSPSDYETGDTVTADDGSEWTKQKDGSWLNVNRETGVRRTIEYGDNDNTDDYHVTEERPYEANGVECYETVGGQFVDNEKVSEDPTRYLTSTGEDCPVLPDGTINSAVGFWPNSFDAGDVVVSDVGQEWTKRPDGSWIAEDTETRCTTTVRYGEGDDPVDYVRTDETAYDTDEGECTEVVTTTVTGREVQSQETDYLNEDGGVCAVKPDGSPNPAAISQTGGSVSNRPRQDGGGEGWDGETSDPPGGNGYTSAPENVSSQTGMHVGGT